MKTKILLIALVILGTTFVHASTPEQETKTNCEKKVLKKIKRKMNMVKFKDYVSEGQESLVILTCTVNEDKVVEVNHIRGANEELNAAIIEKLTSNPVKCESQPSGVPFSFDITFKHISFPN